MNAEERRYSMTDLLYLMRRLRNPQGGCPWDLQQTYKTIAPSTLEEAYEVVDAIENGDLVHLKEELGDLLFQVIFYSQMADEDGQFRFEDVVHLLVEKLLRRHPHVFNGGALYPVDNALIGSDTPSPNAVAEVKRSWEAIKQQERIAKGKHGLLADVPNALPAVTRAVKLQKRAAKVGFDWPDSLGVLEKLQEEISELQHALALPEERRQQSVVDELGDLLFTCANLARHLKVDPEGALRAANTKFTQRFEWMEQAAVAKGLALGEMDAGEWDQLWAEAKSAGSNT